MASLHYSVNFKPSKTDIQFSGVKIQIDDNIRRKEFCDQKKDLLYLFVCQSRHCPSTCQKNYQITLHGSSSQHRSHLTATTDALQTNGTETITVHPTANFKVRYQKGRVHHSRALARNGAQMNVITIQAMHRLGT